MKAFAIERMEQRTLLADSLGGVAGSQPPAAGDGVVVIAAESVAAPLNINQLVQSGRATVTATPGDLGSVANIFDGDNSSLYRTPNVDPIVVEIAFATPKTVREFTLRFSHAGGDPAYRWKVEGAGGALPGPPAWTELVAFTGTASDVDSRRVLASPVSVQRLRLTGERLTGDNYVHLNEWRIVGDVVINSLALVPANTSHSLFQYQTRQLRAEGVADDGARVDLTDRVVWTSSNEAVATVERGLVRGVGVGSATVRAAFGALQINTVISVVNPRQRDLDVTYIERTPKYNFDAAKKDPAPGDLVTFHGHIKNWDNLTPSADYRWELDGATVASGTLTDLGANEERVVTWQWSWQAAPHRIRLVVDPANAVAEFSEANNVVEDRTDGVIVGFWVEQSLYDYFHDRQRDLGIGSNSWEDWAQRQMAKWNEHNATAIWDVTPNGVTDRVRIDKIHVVPDGTLPLNGGLPSNHPDTRDKTVDMMWGFEWNPDSTFYSNTTSRDPGNPFYLEPSLVHEMGHARYLIDNYTFDVANNSSVTQVQIVEPTTGQPVAGTALLPYLAFNSVLYYNQGGGVMTGPYGNNVWSPHEAGALQRIAGRRAVSGNYNAPGNLGEYLNDLPAANHVRFVDGAGQPMAGASVRWYAASSGPGYGGKTFDNVPEYTLSTDEQGYIHLPRDPFLAGQMREAVVRVAHGGQIWYRFFEVAEMNLEYWRGHTQDGNYTLELPLRNAPPEMEVQGFNRTIADGDTTPSPDDLTDFGDVNVAPAGPGDGYAIRTFVVKNRGGLPLQLTGGPRVTITGTDEFSVVYDPSGTVTSQTLTVFQIKFDPRGPGLRTAMVTVSNNDGNENPYNFIIRGNGAVAGGASTFGVKFDDRDADGVRDEGEPGLAGWTVFGDFDEDGAHDVGEPYTVTGADGAYVLGGLRTNANTQVREVQQPGWRRTLPAGGFHTFNPFIDAIQIHDFGNTRRAGVTGRRAFYNNSAYDGRNPAANAADDGAIAPGKSALLPGGTAAFGNVTTFSRGLNGIMVDVELLPPGALTAADFTFRAGTGGEPDLWAAAPVPSSITVRRGAGAGGTDRVTLLWPDGALRNTWLSVTVGATANTGLAAPDRFYFGNLVGDTGAASPLAVTARDVLRTRAARAAAGIADARDFNRDGRINSVDQALVRMHLGRGLQVIRPSLAFWQGGTPLPVALAEVAGGIVGNKLYLVGETSGATLSYDLTTGTWSSATALARRQYQGHHHAAEVINGKLYLFGGLGASSGGKVQIYDPVANAWSLGADMPFAAGSSSSAVINGMVYVAGGIVGSSTTNRVARYSPATNTWAEMAPMPQGRNHAASGTDGGRLFVFGGRGPGSGDSNTVANGFDTVQAYDPASNTWLSSATTGSTLRPLPQARGGTGKAVFHDGEFYVFGGETATGAGATADRVYHRVDVYRVSTNTWRLEAPMPTARHGIFPLLDGNRVVVAGGGIRAGASSSSILEILHLPPA